METMISKGDKPSVLIDDAEMIATQARPCIATLSIDTSLLDGEIAAVVSGLQSLESLLQFGYRVLAGLRADNLDVGIGESTGIAGDLVCFPKLLSREFELLATALGALQFERAHAILHGIKTDESSCSNQEDSLSASH